MVNNSVLFRGFQQYRRSPIAEKNARCTIRIIDDGTHLVGTDDDDLLVLPAFNEFGPSGKSKNEPRTGCTQVISPRIHCTNFVGNEVGCGGEVHVSRHGCDNNEVNFGGIHPALLAQCLDRFGAHIRCCFGRIL